MSKAYTLKHERFGHPPGTVVYEAAMHDYGCANDDTRHTGVEHVSVSLKPDGGYPFFTVPRYYLKQVWCCEKAKAQNVAVCQDCANSGQLSAWLEKTRKASEVANAPIAFTDGNAEAAWIEQSRDLNCPACGGSGHVDDTRKLPERDPSKPAEQQGLFRKFEVYRTDRQDVPDGKHPNCDYFVLDVTCDPHAKAALAAYAAAVAATHPQLAADMRRRYGLEGPTDTARLDFIAKRARCDPKMDGQHVWWPTSFRHALKGNTLRSAIDAAMKDQQP